MSSDTATLNSTDGFVPTAPVKLNGIKFKLVNGKKDVLALGAGALAFPTQVSAAARVAKKFAYCLGGSANPAPIFFGNISYYFDSGLPQQGDRYPELDITPYLKYTPLKTPAHGKRGYALEITSVTLNAGSAVTVKVSDDAAIGTGALYTRIVEPAYTHIRQAFLSVLAVTGFQRVSSHHGPLDLCFNITVGQYRSAPLITFTFGRNSSLGVTADNYLVNVDNSNIYCFGIISAGAKKGSSVIGTFQQQDNLVEFDLEKKRVGMTGSLIALRSNCANFNFTRA
ncbi:hypothetical protein O6H91_07G040400 [Diphasiastrum complanatum]|nr:hypothetical protein O6H91_07G040400 [Diphasiastrum complanatum]